MITCDLCQCKNGPGNYCNDVVANISTVASHSNPKPNEKSSSRTLHIFRGQLCEKCFNDMGELLKQIAVGRIKAVVES